MKNKSKRYRALKDFQGSISNFKEALAEVKKQATAKFDESIDMSIHLNLQKKHTVRDVIVFPHPFERSRKVLVFAKDQKAEEAKAAGADYVGDVDLVEKIQSGWLDFEVAIATPGMMKDITKVARILGGKGLMPNPKARTVVDDVAAAVKEVKAGRKEFRANAEGVLNFAVGKKSMEDNEISQNAKEFYDLVLKKKPTDLKGDYIQSIFISSTMSKSVKLDKKVVF